MITLRRLLLEEPLTRSLCFDALLWGWDGNDVRKMGGTTQASWWLQI